MSGAAFLQSHSRLRSTHSGLVAMPLAKDVLISFRVGPLFCSAFIETNPSTPTLPLLPHSDSLFLTFWHGLAATKPSV